LSELPADQSSQQRHRVPWPALLIQQPFQFGCPFKCELKDFLVLVWLKR